MDALNAIAQAFGLGVATGILVASGGRDPGAALLGATAVFGVAVGGVSAALDDESILAGLIAGAAGSGLAVMVLASVVRGATAREGGRGGVGSIAATVALMVAAGSIALPLLAFAVAAALVWLGLARRRRAQRKHAGLRVLR